MTKELELNQVWPNWPFPTSKPEQGPKIDNTMYSPTFITANNSTDTIISSNNSIDTITIPMPGTVGGATFVFSDDEYEEDSTINILDERAKNYGPFIDMATITQNLKEILHAAPSWGNMDADQQESLEMIVHKIARILNGRPDYADSWVDIAGYARLVSERLEKGIIR
jgi:hypothetical protein